MTTSGVAVEDEDGFTELRDASVPRVDGVSAAANGTPWFFAKRAESQHGIFGADFVRELIAKTDAAIAVEPQETVTMTGSPSAIAAMIHAAAVRKAEAAQPEDVEKAKYNADDLKRLTNSGAAMADGSYPIADEGDLDSAIRAVGRGGADHDAIRRHVEQRAKSLGMTSKIPDNWAADGSLKKDMGAMEMDDTDGMDPTVVLAEPDMDAPGNDTDPGSPAWEAIDAATARKWTSILARARTALDVMSDREALEAASGDPDDMDNALDLSDAACAIDYAISVLAPFAVDEQAEADCGTDEMEMLGKAIAGLDPANLETVEALGPVRKAGRTLSSANEAALRAALQSLQQVLASLPKAPAVADGDTTEMTKEESPEMSDNDTAVQAALDASTPLGTPKEPASAETPAAQGMPGEVAKAQQDPVVPMFDAQGNLTGFVMPDNVVPIAQPPAPAPATDESDGTDGDGTAADDTQMAAADTADAATPTDLAPAPAATVGTPADAVQADDDGNVAKADTPKNDDVPSGMLKSSIQDMVKAAIDDYSAGQADVVKGLEDRNRMLEERNEALTKHAAGLENRLDALENAPAVMAIASNGAIPPPHMLRGQDRGATGTPGALTKAQEMRNAFKASDDATKQQALAQGLNALAIDELSRIHAAGPR
jgi:hypothetical protein